MTGETAQMRAGGRKPINAKAETVALPTFRDGYKRRRCSRKRLRARRRNSGPMITRDHCGKCGRPVVVSFSFKPEQAWTTVVLNRWRTLCPSCFDIEAHKAKVHNSFDEVEAMSWSDRPPPRNPYKRKR